MQVQKVFRQLNVLTRTLCFLLCVTGPKYVCVCGGGGGGLVDGTYPDSGVTVGFSDTDICVTFDIGGLRATEGLKILDVIIDVLNGE